MSETVVRTGWPCSPKMSQKVTGLPSKAMIAELEQAEALLDLRCGRARLADPGQVALDVGHEDRARRSG